MKYYLLVFSVVYIIATILFGILSMLVNVSSSTGVPILLAASFFTSGLFVKREQRIPNKNEKTQLIWGSIACTFIISIILVFLVSIALAQTTIWIELIQNVPIWVWLLATSLMIVIEFLVFYLGYGWFAKKCLNDLNKKSLQ